MKRAADLMLALVACAAFLLPMLLISAWILCEGGGPVLYWSERIGKENGRFWMPKFRTMRRGTPAVATHLLSDSGSYVTPIGRVLRRWSLDELPQLWSVLRGDMGFVGPRPALFNQYDLIEARTKVGVHHLVPGLTGLAQVSGRDHLSIEEKVKKDLEYLNGRCFALDLHILWLTFFKVLGREGVSH